jgi:hypothetical protein
MVIASENTVTFFQPTVVGLLEGSYCNKSRRDILRVGLQQNQTTLDERSLQGSYRNLTNGNSLRENNRIITTRSDRPLRGFLMKKNPTVTASGTGKAHTCHGNMPCRGSLRQ